MANVTIWHNPRCGKSRDGVKLLEEKGVDAEIVKYLDTPPTKEELKELLKMLGISARELMRSKEAIYKECILKAQRKVAKRYDLIQRMYPLTAVACEDNCDDLTGPEATEDIVLPMTNFMSEYEVLINEKPYTKVERITNQSVDEYVLQRNENSILFN